MTKKTEIGKELYVVIEAKQFKIRQLDKGLRQNGHTLRQSEARFSYFIDLYYYLSYSSLYIREIYKMNKVLGKAYREHRKVFQRRKFVKKFEAPKKLYNMEKKQLFLDEKRIYWIKSVLFCLKVAKKSLRQPK